MVITTLALAQPRADTVPGLDHSATGENSSLTSAPTQQWSKWIDNLPWSQELVVTVETSDTIEIVDVVTTLPSEPLELVEVWNPEHLALLNYEVEPSGSIVVTDEGTLTWQLPEGRDRVFTLTKLFHVEPCTWARTILRESLSIYQDPIEERRVTIDKEPPQLWIDSFFDVAVVPGDVAIFTLSYGNDGGYENDVSIRNEFPDTAPFLWADPAPDDRAADGSWAQWLLNDLAKGDQGDITVAVEIQETVAPSSTIEVWDWIYDHVGEQRDSVVTTFHVERPPEAEWRKFVNGVAWHPQLLVTAETSDTIQIVDVVTTLPFEPVELVEHWNPEHLALREFQVYPSGSTVVTEKGTLTWQLPEGGQVFTLTKWLHVEPCLWERTVLLEELSTHSQPLEERPVVIDKEPPQLWIDSFFDVTVLPGDVATFTLRYGNAGGSENDVSIRNVFPGAAPFLWSDPPPDDVGPGGSSATWIIGDLAKDDAGEITVAVGIQETVPPSDTIEIWDWIYDHVGEERGSVVTTFHVGQPPDAEWWKYVDGEAWHPQLVVTVETGDIVDVVDVVDSPRPFTLLEQWNSAHVKLLRYHVTAGHVFTLPGSLEWQGPLDPMGPVTLTKQFRVEGGPWNLNILEEYLTVVGVAEPQVRLIRMEHLFPPIDFPGGDWPWYAQGEISVSPEPPLVGQPTHICGEVVNYDPTHPHTVTLEFAVANFGIGLPFSPIGHTDVTVPPGGHATGCVVWVPPTPDHWCIEARLIRPEDDEPYRISQRNVDADEPLRPNTPHARTFPVGNPFPFTVTIKLDLIPHVQGWGIELSQDVLPDMAPSEVREVTLTATPPDDLPPGGTVVVDVEAYAMGKLFGGFRKVFHPPIILHRFPDPPYAEREITVHPYPPLAGQPTEVCVELRNPTSAPYDVAVQFSWADFGIGIPFTPINGLRPVHLPAHSLVKECIHWVPPVSGHVCLQVELFMDGHHPQRSQRNIDVDEPLRPLVPHSLAFPVGNPLTERATVTLETITHLSKWEAKLSPQQLPDMAPGEVREVVLTVMPPAQLPPEGTAVVDVEAYANEQLIGGFRKVFRPPVTLHPLPDPPYAEREITVHPEPPLVGWPTQICVELRNPTPVPQDVMVQFSWANFGIGIPFTPINGLRPVHLPAHSLVNECIHWIPPVGGHVCLQVELFADGYEVQRSQRNVDVAEVLVPGEPDSVVFRVGNPLTERVTVTLGVITHLPGWEVELSPDQLPNMGPGETRPVTLTVVPPDELPDDGDVVVEVEAYAKGRLIGGFRKAFRPPVPIHRPKDPVYAESEIFVDPYPVIPGVPTKLGVEVFNPTNQDEIVTATFSIAHFGIGLPFTTSHIVPNPIRIFVPRHGAARGHVFWRPPLWRGKFCVRVTLQVENHEPLWSQRNIDLGEPLRPGQPHALPFQVGAWPYTEPVTVALGLVPHMAGWELELSPDILPNVKPGEPVTATLTVIPPADAQLGTGAPIVDVEGFVDGQLIGGFRKLDIPPIPVHKVHEPTYAESEIHVDPYPPQAGQPTQVSAVLQNTSGQTATVNLTYGWAKFGVGIPFTTTGMAPPTRTLSLRPHMTGTAGVTWTPITSGHQCLQVILTDPEGHYAPQRSQLNLDVSERPPCGTTKVFTFTVYNDSPFTVTVQLGLITFNVPPDWEVTTVPSDTLDIGPFGEAVVRVILEIPCPSTLAAMAARQALYALQEEAGSVPTIDVEAYVDGELKGGIELQFPGPEERFVYLPVVLRNGP
jgi:hypothetical protein